SGYAEMADSIVKGRGLQVDYISWYFRKYDPGILRPEDHWPPLYSFLIVPFFLFMGKTAFAAKLPSLLISAFALPLTTFALAERVARSKAVAFASAITALLYYPIFNWSLHCLSDVTYAFLIVAVVLCAVKGFDDSRWFWAMGAFLAFAYYAKGSTPVIGAAIVVYYLVWRVLARPARRWMRRDTRFVVSIVIFFAIMTPWFIRNTIHFGNPIYSTQNHAAGYIGWKGWEEGTYELYWGEKPAPSLTDKRADPERWAKESAAHYKRHFWWVFLRMDKGWGDFDRNDLTTYWTGAPALLGMGLFGLMALCGIALRFRRGEGAGRSVWRWLKPFFVPEYGLFLLVGAMHLSFLSVAWEPISRLTFPLVPLVVVMGWATVFALVERGTEWSGRSRLLASVVVIAFLSIWVNFERGVLLEARRNNGYAWKEGAQDWQELGHWIHENAPGSVTMTRNPWELHFYSEELAVQVPLATLDRIIDVAHYYGATHLIPEKNRPALELWLKGDIPGLEKVHTARGLPLYRIHYDQLPDDLRPD
ncbi:MAG: glycosyltransferase family 39 protein, partial [Candidatus Poribacteria bacterium]|nr:glycosyltransferase family 39 protein [Candidatus Poribacteria bacterium]